jgi:hypothetical protein
MFGEGSLNTTFFADREINSSTNGYGGKGYGRYVVLIYDDDAHLLQDDDGNQLYGI